MRLKKKKMDIQIKTVKLHPCIHLFYTPLNTTVHTFWCDEALRPSELKEPALALGNSL